MGTMQAQAGTPMAIEESLRSNDPFDNCSIIQALAYQQYLEKLGLGFDKLTASTADGKRELTLAQVQAMGINQGAPLKITGTVGKAVIVIAKELLEIAGKNGLATFLDLFLARHPELEGSEGKAYAALLKLDLVRLPMLAALNQVKKESGVI